MTNPSAQIKRGKIDRNRFIVLLSIALAFGGALIKTAFASFPYLELVGFLGPVAIGSYGIKSYRDLKENENDAMVQIQGDGKVDPLMGQG